MMLSLSLSLLLLLVPRPSTAEPWAQMLEDLAKQQGLEGDFNVSFYTLFLKKDCLNVTFSKAFFSLQKQMKAYKGEETAEGDSKPKAREKTLYQCLYDYFNFQET